MEFLPLRGRALLRILMITQEVDNKFLSCMSHQQKPSDFGVDLHHDPDSENFNENLHHFETGQLCFVAVITVIVRNSSTAGMNKSLFRPVFGIKFLIDFVSCILTMVIHSNFVSHTPVHRVHSDHIHHQSSLISSYYLHRPCGSCR